MRSEIARRLPLGILHLLLRSLFLPRSFRGVSTSGASSLGASTSGVSPLGASSSGASASSAGASDFGASLKAYSSGTGPPTRFLCRIADNAPGRQPYLWLQTWIKAIQGTTDSGASVKYIFEQKFQGILAIYKLFPFFQIVHEINGHFQARERNDKIH